MLSGERLRIAVCCMLPGRALPQSPLATNQNPINHTVPPHTVDSYVIPTKRDFLPGVTKRQLESARSRETDDRFKLHYDAAIMRKAGSTIGEISEELSLHPGTIINCLRRMSERGPGEGYRVRQGRPPKFTPEQLKKLEDDMERPPKRHGLAADSWTSTVVAEHAMRRFGISITPGSMRRLMTTKKMRWPGSAAAMAAGVSGRGSTGRRAGR